MRRTIKLTERDLSRIVKRVINENMDNDTAFNVYRKLKQEGEIMDETYKRIKNIREELDMMVMRHVRGGTANTIFDSNQRTPGEVSDNVQQLSRKVDELEGLLSQYKRFIRGAISL
jgi:hypothetical protein